MHTKQYLEYLDKEMTIMGILSAVSVAAPAGILNTILGDPDGVKARLWDTGQFFILAGSVLCVIAAYGQICLAEAVSDKKSSSKKLREWLLEADSWKT